MNKRCGFVALIGRPNVGKSTLLNELVGYKVSAIADKPQTTRNRIQGVVTEEAFQIVFVDTPGVHRYGKTLLNKALNVAAVATVESVDLVVMVVEAGEWRREDDYVLSKLRHVGIPVVLAINKVDRFPNKGELLVYIDTVKDKFDFAEIVPISALKGVNTKELVNSIIQYLPESEFLYPEDQITDKPIRFIAAEMIREQLMRTLREEVPYSVAVEIETFDEGEAMISIGAVIWLEREGQKAIVIGRRGAMLKRIGTEARKSLEDFLGKKVFLKLWVKVKENWQNDMRQLVKMGIDVER